jgi:DNA-binding NarL/FixJ family response regulator
VAKSSSARENRTAGKWEFPIPNKRTALLPLVPLGDRNPALRGPTREATIAVIDNCVTTRSILTVSLQHYANGWTVLAGSRIEDLASEIAVTDVVLLNCWAPADYDKYLAGYQELATTNAASCPLIMLGPNEEPDKRFYALRNGVRGYVSRCSISIDQLIDVIYLIREGGTFICFGSLQNITRR